MSELGPIVKSAAEDAAQGAEKVGKAIVEHLDGIGGELKNAAVRYRGAEETGEQGFKNLLADGGKDAERAAGRAGTGTATGVERGVGARAAAGPRNLAAESEREAQFAAREHGAGGATDDPIDLVTGEMFLPQRDLALPGVLSLVLERRHGSGYRHGRWFGTTWSSTLDQRIEIDDDGIHYAAPDGRVLHYPIPALPGQRVMPAYGPRWPLTWDRRENRDTVAIEQTDLGITLLFPRGPLSESGRPVHAVVDRSGNRITFAYDEEGAPTDVYHSGGYHVVVGSTATRAGIRVDSLKLADPRGGPRLPIREFRYDLAGRLVETIEAGSGLQLVFDYDERDRITRWSDRNGNQYTYDYREDGRVHRARGTGGYLDVRLEYDLQSQTTTKVDALGHRAVYRWDEQGRTYRTADPLGGETRAEHDRFGGLLAWTDALGRTTRIERDENGDQIRIEYSDGHVASESYDVLRRPVSVTDPGGGVWLYEYAEHDQPTAVTDPAGAVCRFVYDERGRILESVDPLGRTMRFRCDVAGLPIESADPLGAVTRCRRDPFGRIVEVIDPLGATTTFERDLAGRLLKRTAPDGTAESWAYDDEGNLVEHTSPAGAITGFEYGPFDHVVARTDPDGSRYTFAYDAQLNLTTVTGPTGRTWDYEYDANGNLIAESDFNGATHAYTLDAAGQLIERADSTGNRMRFLRDPRGRVVERRTGDQVHRYRYDPAGRLRHAQSPGSSLELIRDPLGRVLSETTNGRVVSNAYDAAGRRVSRTTPGGVTTVWTYDDAGRPQSMAGTGGWLTFQYDAVGRETERALGPAAAITQSYDQVGRLRTQAVWAYDSQRTEGVPATAEPRSLLTRVFDYRSDGVPIAVQDSLRGTRTYELDVAGRVTALDAATWRETYAYDELGNLSRSTGPIAETGDDVRTGNSAEDGNVDSGRDHQGTLIRRAGRTRYEHDAAGRLVRRTRRTLSGQTKVWAYAWDADGRLATATAADGVTWSYTYDPLGRRIAKNRLGDDRAPLETIWFAWDGPRLAEEARTTAGGQATFLTWDYEPDGFAPVAQTRHSWPTDTPQDGIDYAFYAIVTDAVGTPTELVTPDGGLAWHTTRSVWGRIVAASQSTTDCPLGFPGQYRDDETGLYYNVNRYYDPQCASYLSPDPLGFVPAPNNTAYVANPLIESDPLGLFSCYHSVQQDLAAKRGQMNMRGVQQEDAFAAASPTAKGVKNTLGKMEFDGNRDPVYGINGQLSDRNAAYPGKGHGIAATSFQDHAEGDMAYQAKKRGYSGGNAALYTDRATCNWCRQSMSGYARFLNLDTITVYDPNGLVGIWDQTGKIG